MAVLVRSINPPFEVFEGSFFFLLLRLPFAVNVKLRL